jgi:hypothetical protein
MPVTARLSRLFYERLGEQVANELVEWFNAVDLTYRTDLREMNELNYARFSADVGARFSAQDARIDRLFAEFEVRMEKRFAEFEVRMEKRFADFEVRIEKRFAEFEVRMEKRFAEMSVQMERGFREQMRFLYVALVAQLALLAGLYLR